ncbi:uncharacterized protein LOC110447478 isoform X2 [Mizuhopecten yessoensis]|uniref:Endoplasmic reticulum interferon stimulator n=1 Tax=Mizuhopecten yessoensis TaxID=6573 RepID=A0A210QVA3_MIZYE|nr:uncharacterized protein LOC110447478 isoform X2 [Mizuhopecten yessoensis]OWF52650.1 Endoplasmic reticulum interferon stimulator [Mizuhopecten yessoensis]
MSQQGSVDLDQTEVKDLYLTYYEEDDLRIKKTILPFLDKSGISYNVPGDEGESGLDVEIMHRNLIRCRKTLLILSQKGLDKYVFSLQMLLSLEKSVERNQMSLIILLIDELLEDKIPRIPLLQHACHIVLDNNLHERCMTQLCTMVKAETTLNELLPAGNFATGMAWSHFQGYLKIILPELATHVTRSKWFQAFPGHMPVCLFMLLPTSAHGPPSISDLDPNIQYVGTLHIPVAGREFTPAVYKITEKIGDQKTDYYCCAEYPSALCALGIMDRQRLCDFRPRERMLEVERFHYKLQEIINHDKNRACNDLAKSLIYNDEEKGEQALPSYHLLRAIKEEVKNKLACHQSAIYKDADFKTDACLLYSSDDKKTAFKIRDHLQQQNFKVTVARPGVQGDPIIEVQERVLEARWVVMVVSQNTLRSVDWLGTFLSETLSLSSDNKALRVLPVLLDVCGTSIPHFIRWVTYIDKRQEENYLERISEAVAGRCVTLQSSIPIGDVAFGLAWAFHVNYLRHVLPDLKERIEKSLKSKELKVVMSQEPYKQTHVSSTLYQIIPRSCCCTSTLTEKKRVGISEQEKDNVARIKGPFTVHPIRKDIAGTIGRVFPCKMYKIESERSDYYFCGEFVTPVKTLKEMNQSMIAGLSNQQMYSQSQQFKTQLEAILKSQATLPAYRDKCRVIEYDDKQEELSDVMMNAINAELRQGSDRVKRYWDFVATEQQGRKTD